ncbi:ABC transporter ATP-binding protein [Fusibacter paucivorans]|uniref:ABC transporter ATP-binding protein n=1 Tax=Fusibacter paucivorans TaxID=76009 RepID=A0ABS5PRT3_9FIRM|nr:dipeptide/oligopeptide/nickel ABC transporter ATP-binding protein [Fusibacter paucivorans]MBS7527864.1 ABC transporter ATP-binding protein [Fusibacter paucivorans]
MIELKHVTKIFKQGLGQTQIALDNVSFDIPQGTIMGIAGNSGCGKSTLARVMMGLIPPTSGSVLLDGKAVSSYSRKERSQSIQMIFQHPAQSFDPKMMFEHSLMEALKVSQRIDRDKFNAAIREMLSQVDLSETLLHRYPHEVSGGEAQRMAIARALLLKPKIMVMDEGTSMLDVSVQAKLFDVLTTAQKRTGMTMILISHDLEVISKTCQTLAVIYCGSVVEQGTTEQLLTRPKTAYVKKLVEEFAFFDI